jgi:hypothetical protein
MDLRSGDGLQSALYSIEGDTLKICIAAPGDDRPTALSAEAGSKCTLFTFRRSEEQSTEGCHGP